MRCEVHPLLLFLVWELVSFHSLIYDIYLRHPLQVGDFSFLPKAVLSGAVIVLCSSPKLSCKRSLIIPYIDPPSPLCFHHFTRDLKPFKDTLLSSPPPPSLQLGHF